MNLSSKGACETCKFYSALKLECRRYPPTPFLMMEQQPNGTARAKVVGAYPASTKAEWCGEFVPEIVS